MIAPEIGRSVGGSGRTVMLAPEISRSGAQAQ
jgi:hypothetical protein